MLFNLLYPLADQVSLFNLFRYITFRTGGAVLTALVISFVVGPALIRWLRVRQGQGQPIRADGPRLAPGAQAGHADHGRHADPARARRSRRCSGPICTNGYVWVVLLITLGFGGIGLVDDYLKLTKRSSGGLAARIKLLGQCLVALIAAVLIALR